MKLARITFALLFIAAPLLVSAEELPADVGIVVISGPDSKVQSVYPEQKCKVRGAIGKLPNNEGFYICANPEVAASAEAKRPETVRKGEYTKYKPEDVSWYHPE